MGRDASISSTSRVRDVLRIVAFIAVDDSEAASLNITLSTIASETLQKSKRQQNETQYYMYLDEHSL